MLKEIVAYTFKRLREENLYARTFIQKIVYFTLDSEERKQLYIPYRYGPYSESVQRLVQFLEANPTVVNKWIFGKELDIQQKVDRIIELIKTRKMRTTDIALLSKVYFLKNDEGISDIPSIKETSYALGWREVFEKEDKEIKKILNGAEKLIKT